MGLKQIFPILLFILTSCTPLVVKDRSDGKRWDDPMAEMPEAWKQETFDDKEGSDALFSFGRSNSDEPPVIRRPTNQIYYGMEMHEAANLWGEPTRVDYAGEPDQGNQRWNYREGRVLY